MTTVKSNITCTVGGVHIGNCFMDKDILYMKTDLTPPGNPNKSVCLVVATGTTQLFGIHEQVVPVDVEVTIV